MRFLAAAAVLLAAGCVSLAPDRSHDNGVVESVRPVQLSGARSADGIFAGAALGGVLAESLSDGGFAATVLGTVAGGFAGDRIERDFAYRYGQEMVIRLDDGRTIDVVQPGSYFGPGQRVRVFSGPRGPRVEPG